jgi:uncharacterized damage-inducible protein DinB
MKAMIISVFLGITLASFCQDSFLEDYKKKWANAASFTLEIAEAMPETHYLFRPAEEEMTFKKQLVHMAGNMIWLSSAYLNAGAFDEDLDNPPDSKQAIIELLRRSFQFTSNALDQLGPDALNEEVSFYAEPLTKRRILFLMTDHITHHRGQLVVYLRLNKIKPPGYLGW